MVCWLLLVRLGAAAASATAAKGSTRTVGKWAAAGSAMHRTNVSGKNTQTYMSWRQNDLFVAMVEFTEGAPYRFAGLGGIVLGYRFLGCPASFCSGVDISLLIEKPPLLLYNNGNFDPASHDSRSCEGTAMTHAVSSCSQVAKRQG